MPVVRPGFQSPLAAAIGQKSDTPGGVGPANIREIAEAGVDTFVAGSAVFGAGKDGDPNRYDSIIKALRDELAQAQPPKAHGGGCCGGGHH